MPFLVKVDVSVEYFGLIRQTLRVSEESVHLNAGDSVEQVFAQLAERHGDLLRKALLAPRGEPLPNVVLTLDGRRIVDRRGMQQPIHRDVRLQVLQMPPFTGGG